MIFTLIAVVIISAWLCWLSYRQIRRDIERQEQRIRDLAPLADECHR